MTSSLAKRLASDPVSKVELSIRCNHLLNKDITSLSDPCCVVYLMTGNAWTELGRTEQIKNNLNPVFSKLFPVDYYFEEVQKVRFLVYDIDNTTTTLNDDDFLGSLECTLGEIVSNSPFTKPLLLKGTKVAGKSTITIRAQETSSSNEILTLQFSAKNLDNKDFLGKSDPYLEFHRRLKDGGYQLVHRTEVIRNNLNPRWRPFEIRTSRLCDKNNKEPIKIECYDHDDDGSNDFIGSFETNVEQILLASGKILEWPCINPKKKAKKKNYTNSGVVVLSSCITKKEFSFLDYVFGGLQINFTVGVDFTASNGDPRDSRSLHFMNQSQPNLYMRAIHSVGQVIQDYDSDQMFPALGYGAKIPPTSEVSHCFPLNFNAQNPFCAGIQGVLDAYRMCLASIQLYGPTNFSPIIYHVAQFSEAAHRERKPKNYYVLLIITDGVISDMDDTIRAVVYASTLPMSIIIVGVGEADFQAMDILDGDGGILRDAHGNCAKRDIVQFVPFRNFVNVPPAALAKQVLAEVPDQVSSYYRANNIEPDKPKPMDSVIRQLEEINQAITPTSVPSSVYPKLSDQQTPSGQYPPPHQAGSHPTPYLATQPGYPATQPGYPATQPGYPATQPGYPANQPGYPATQPGYPANQPGYPATQPGYQAPQPGHPATQPGYPATQPGYPAAQPTPTQVSNQSGYPSNQMGQNQPQIGVPPGRPSHPPGHLAKQSGYSSGQPGYPQGQPGYPSGQAGFYPQNQHMGGYGYQPQYGNQTGFPPNSYPGQYPQGVQPYPQGPPQYGFGPQTTMQSKPPSK